MDEHFDKRSLEAMEIKKKGLILGLFILVCTILFVAIFFTSAFAGDVIIVCNKSVTADSLTQSEIKDIFLGRKTRWSDGNKINFATLEEGQTHEVFLKSYVSKTARQFGYYWDKQVFTGRGKTPKSFKTAKGLINYVSNTDGAIGYIAADEFDSNVKVLRFTQGVDRRWIKMLVTANAR
jgi:ABC-type phosphate transport system substrate-binding protein